MKIFCAAYPWLFPGGIGDIYDEERGSVKDLTGPVKCIKSWANHLLHYYDGRFREDQLFGLYLHNTIQRHENNTKGAFFVNDKIFLVRIHPLLMTSKLRYAKAILHLYQNFDTTVRAYVEVMDFGKKDKGVTSLD